MEIAIVVLIGILLYQGFIGWLDRREAKQRESELLNRLMARDYAQYAQAKITEKFYDKEPVEGEQREYGIPVRVRI